MRRLQKLKQTYRYYTMEALLLLITFNFRGMIFLVLPKPAVVAAVSKKYNPVKPMNCVRSASCNGNRIYVVHANSQRTPW